MKWRFGTSHVAEVFCTDAASSCAGAGIPSTFDNTPKSVTPGDGSSLDGRHSSLVMQIAYRFIEGGMVSPRVAGRLFRRGRCARADNGIPLVGKKKSLPDAGLSLLP